MNLARLSSNTRLMYRAQIQLASLTRASSQNTGQGPMLLGSTQTTLAGTACLFAILLLMTAGCGPPKPNPPKSTGDKTGNSQTPDRDKDQTDKDQTDKDQTVKDQTDKDQPPTTDNPVVSGDDPPSTDNANASSDPPANDKPTTNDPTADTTPAANDVRPELFEHGFTALAALPESPPVPRDNPLTPAKVALGKLLFFDDRLSGDVGTSCASCHDPRLGWGDGNALSRGYAGTQHWRNSQTTVNTAYLSKLFWAGEVPSLEAQAHSAISGNLAGNGDSVMIEERLAQIPTYIRQFKDAFGVQYPTYGYALKAIASFERSAMNSTDSPYDQYMRGDQAALTDGAKRGFQLFVDKAKCIRCHNGALLSDENFHNLGVPKNGLFEKDPNRQIALRYQHYIRGVPEPVYRSADRDLGLFYTTKRDVDKGRFRTPPLRYSLYTAPYMHNGVFDTLEDVIDFYDRGGGDDVTKSPMLEPLGLTDDEKFDLLEFLEALSGAEIRMRPPELPAYESYATAPVDEPKP